MGEVVNKQFLKKIQMVLKKKNKTLKRKLEKWIQDPRLRLD